MPAFSAFNAAAGVVRGENLGPVTPAFASDTEVDATPTSSYLDIATDGSTMVAVGGNGSTTTIVRYSTNDGVTWANATITAPGGFGRVEFADGIFIAVGGANTTDGAYVYSSTDGQTWTQEHTTGTQWERGVDVKYSPTHDTWAMTTNMAAGTQVPRIYTAGDPTGTWTNRTLTAFNGSAYAEYIGELVVNELDGEFFAVGVSYDSSFFSTYSQFVWKTTNGTTWSGTPVVEGLSQSEITAWMTYVPAEDVFCTWSGANDLDYYTNPGDGFPGTQNTIDDASASATGIGKIKLNSAGGVLCAYSGTTGITASDGVTTSDRYQVDTGSGIIEAVIQHKLQYFAVGWNGSNGAIYELEL